MPDAGTRYTDAAQAELERRFRAIYREAQEDIIKKLDAHTKRLNALDKIKRAQVEAGTLSQEEYRNWLNGQVFIGKQWKDKVDSVATSLLYANQQANDMIEGKKRAVFGENATFQAYSIEHDAGMDLSFGIYDSATVTRLIKEQPELLPRRKVDADKDMGWNQHNIANAVTQGIIQGESIPQIAARIARQTARENDEAMTRYARTAMTGAQSAGRWETMHEAQQMGINVKKQWMAHLDNRTRDSHRNLDQQIAEVDEPFQSDFGEIMFPGDFHAHPADVYNCRCRLKYVYPEYYNPKDTQRRAYNDNRTESTLIPDMTYNEWKAWKTGGRQLFGQNEQKKEKQFIAAKTIEEAIEKAENAGVKYARFNGMTLERANNLLEAIETLPEDCRPLFVTGTGKDVSTVTGRPMGRKADQWYGVTYDYRGFGLRTMQLGYRESDYEGGIVVGINTTKFKTIDDLTEAKVKEQAKYKAKTGHEWFFNTDGKATAFHEMGHCYHNIRSEKIIWEISGKKKTWEDLSARWAEESLCDMLKNPDEAFAEAWAAYYTKGRELPEYISQFIGGLE